MLASLIHLDFFLLAVPWSLWGLSSLTKVQTHVPCSPNPWTAMKVPRFYFCIYPALIFLPPKWNCPSIPSQIAYIIPIGLKYHFIILRILTCNLVSPGTQFCPTDLTFSCLNTFISLLPFSFQICPSRYILSIPVVRKNFQKHGLTVLCHCLKLQYMFAREKKAKWSSVYRLTCSNTPQLTTFCHNGSWQAMPLLEFRSVFFVFALATPHSLQDLSFQPAIDWRTTAAKAPSPNHWTAGAHPAMPLKKRTFLFSVLIQWFFSPLNTPNKHAIRKCILTLHFQAKTYAPIYLHESFLAQQYHRKQICIACHVWKCESESEVAQLCLTLCDPMDHNLPGSSVHGIFQARGLEWVAISFSRGSSRLSDWTWVSHIAGRRFTIWATREAPSSGKPHILCFAYVCPSRRLKRYCLLWFYRLLSAQAVSMCLEVILRFSIYFGLKIFLCDFIFKGSLNVR